MHHLLAFALLGTVSASAAAAGDMVQARALVGMNGITERQFDICVPVPVGPDLCGRSCGPGFITCVSLPNCFNPGAGDKCCSDGTRCLAGTYCTDAGCCPDGTPLAECGATVTLSVVPPPDSTPPPEETSSSAPEETSSAPPEETSSAPPEETSSAPPVETYSPPVETYSPPATESSAAPTTSAPPEYSQSANGTAPTSRPPPPVTAGAARLGTHVFAGLGGLGAALMAL